MGINNMLYNRVVDAVLGEGRLEEIMFEFWANFCMALYASVESKISDKLTCLASVFS